jgi:hypothetical protein
MGRGAVKKINDEAPISCRLENITENMQGRVLAPIYPGTAERTGIEKANCDKLSIKVVWSRLRAPMTLVAISFPTNVPPIDLVTINGTTKQRRVHDL